MKNWLIGFCFLGSCITLSAQSDKADLKLNYRIDPTNDWVYYAPASPQIGMTVINDNDSQMSSTVKLEVMTDQYVPLCMLSQSVSLQNGDSVNLNFDFTVPSPGFYRCAVWENNEVVKRFNIGYEPESIVSLSDAQPDLREFWDRAKAELAQVAPEYQLTQITDDTNKSRKLYLVKMKSLGGEEISGYYSVPTKKGKYPAVISYMGYGSKPWIPGGSADEIHFVLSVRGQGLQEPTNKYGDWITYNLNSKDDYYYRGAFMDLVRAVDFVSSRPEVDTECIFAEGGSQGGAFSMAAAALDNRFCAIGPTIPFLSDYPDYFKTVHWPAEPVLKKQKELGMSDNELYQMLSYFDIKNLSPWIECPVIMGVGLQDEVCPPHTNFSGYNRISTDKEYYIYPLNGHNTPDSWNEARKVFFEKQAIKKKK